MILFLVTINPCLLLYYFDKIVQWLSLILHCVFQGCNDLGNNLVWGIPEIDPLKRIQGQVSYQDIQERPTGRVRQRRKPGNEKRCYHATGTT